MYETDPVGTRAARLPQRRRRRRHRRSTPRALLEVGQRLEAEARPGPRRAVGAAHARRRRAARTATSRSTTRPRGPAPAAGRSATSCSRRSPTSGTRASNRARVERRAPDRPNIAGPVGPETGTPSGPERKVVMPLAATPTARTFALVGPGRAGTSVALALVGAGWRAGRGRRAAASTRRRPAAPSPRLGVAAGPRRDGRARTPTLVVDRHARRRDRRRRRRARAVPRARRARGAPLRRARPRRARRRSPSSGPTCASARCTRCRRFPAPDPGAAPRRVGCGRRSAGGRRPRGRARLHPFVVDRRPPRGVPRRRVVASNHLVALLGQVERLAAAAGVPFEAFLPLIARDGRQLRRPRARGRAHRPGRARRPRDRRRAPRRAARRRAATTYRALRSRRARLTGRDDAELRALLQGVLA